MGAPKLPDPIKPPTTDKDASKAIMNALAYAETEKKLRAGSGRKSTFLAGSSGSLLGM